MNRIRKLNNHTWQVLITPDISVSPDNALIMGNWADENLRNYTVLEFSNLQDAQCEALKYPDIDWYRLIINHEFIYKRLKSTLENIIKTNNFNVQFIPNIMDPNTFKNAMFNRVIHNGARFNLKTMFTDLISFTIISPWSKVLQSLSLLIERHREWLYRDDLRIKSKKIIDGKIICLFGYTEAGTTYEIKLIPSLLYQWSITNPDNDNLYQELLRQQHTLDNGPVVI